MNRVLAPLLLLALLLGGWHVLAARGAWSPVLLPAPLDVGRWLAGALADGTLASATLVTGRRLLVGYAVGLLLGVPLGFLAARGRLAGATLGPLAVGLQSLPSVCWVPLALLWFGQTEAAVTFVVVMGTTWSIVVATQAGVRNVPPIYARAARTMGSRGLHTLLQVTLPAALPVVVGGMKQGWAFAWRSLMAAEIFVTILTGFGLGHLLHHGRELHAMDQVLGVIFVILAIGLVVDRLAFAPAERLLRRRFGLEV